MVSVGESLRCLFSSIIRHKREEDYIAISDEKKKALQTATPDAPNAEPELRFVIDFEKVRHERGELLRRDLVRGNKLGVAMLTFEEIRSGPYMTTVKT
ncbi:hypothetical protein Y032_0002g917 [Ancylostoma ceylanicum]|uniref:Uncharacterized protein n=1 Tax=Ancylostoma ceylanicum TaxID=53326 RepID=A0A016W1Y8_9BILA|nr:hypothetical protein Y032_0002g917 [Ancylostoma ceylanicum]